jgi:hypothetical protein
MPVSMSSTFIRSTKRRTEAGISCEMKGGMASTRGRSEWRRQLVVGEGKRQMDSGRSEGEASDEREKLEEKVAPTGREK